MGVFCGILGAVFSKGVQLVTGARLDNPWLLYLLPAAGILTAAIYKLLKVSGMGTDQVLNEADGQCALSAKLAPAVFFLSLLSVTNMILQATGHAARPMLSMLLGAAVKTGAAYLLIGLPTVGGTGVPIGTLLCYLVALSANLVFLLRDEGISPSLSRTFLRPALASVFSVGGGLGFYLLLGGEAAGHAATLAAILMAAAIYLAAIFLTRTVTDEDLALIPGISKIRKLFTKNKQKLINSAQHSQ
jgi:stage V sporulation protein B